MKLPVFSYRHAQKMLRKLDVEFEQTKEVHAYFRYQGNVITRFTFPGIHGRSRDLSDGERKSLETDSELSRSDFIDLVNCPMGREEYVAALKAKGIIPPKASDADTTDA